MSELVDLTARRLRHERAIAEVAAAPVRFVPAEFLAALYLTDARPVVEERRKREVVAPVAALR